MSLPRRKLLLKSAPHNPNRPGPIETSPEECFSDLIVPRPEECFSDLIVPRLLSGRSKSQKKLGKAFLRRGINVFVNQCSGLLYFAESSGNIGPSVIWNPKTDEERYLPPPGDDALRAPAVCWSIVFASCFGYDARSDDYKVLAHVRHFPYITDEDGHFEDDDGPTVERYILYSLKNNRWTEFPCPSSPYHTLSPGSGSVNLKGNCFWISWGFERVVSFSFSDESFASFPLEIPTVVRVERLPIDTSVYYVTMVDAVEEDTLAFVVYRLSHFQLWTCVINDGRMPEADEDGCRFVMRWEIFVDFPEECGVRGKQIGRPLGLHQNGDELVMFMANSNEQLMVYNLAAKELKLLPIFSHPDADKLELISYHETAESLADY